MTFKEIAYCSNISGVNFLYLLIDKMIGHFEEESGKGYLVLDDIDQNKEVSKKYEEVWDGIKKEIERINGVKKIKCEKDLKKIRLESNDHLPKNKPIKLRLLKIIIRCVFSEDDKFYPQLFLDDALYDI